MCRRGYKRERDYVVHDYYGNKRHVSDERHFEPLITNLNEDLFHVRSELDRVVAENDALTSENSRLETLNTSLLNKLRISEQRNSEMRVLNHHSKNEHDNIIKMKKSCEQALQKQKQEFQKERSQLYQKIDISNQYNENLRQQFKEGQFLSVPPSRGTRLEF